LRVLGGIIIFSSQTCRGANAIIRSLKVNMIELYIEPNAYTIRTMELKHFQILKGYETSFHASSWLQMSIYFRLVKWDCFHCIPRDTRFQLISIPK
jgi:hypothetical protein